MSDPVEQGGSSRVLRMFLVQGGDPSVPSDGANVDFPLPDGVSGTAVLNALTTVFAAEDWDVEYAETVTTTVDTVVHPIS